MASPPTRPTSFKVTSLMLQAARDLVFICGLQPNGLEPAQLDLIFLDDHKSKNFFFSYYALRRQLGPVNFWALIAELNDERTGMSYLSSYYSITTNHSPGNKRAQLALSAAGSPPAVPHASAYPSDHTADRRILQTHGDTITTPNSDYLDQASPNRKLSQSVVPGRQRSRSTLGKRIQCGKPFSYEASWKKHWAEFHEEHFKLDTPDGKKEYGCVHGCLRSFERSALMMHLWEEHAKELDAGILSSNMVGRFETANSHQISSNTNTFPGASSQPPSSFQSSYGNQSQPGPHYVKCDTSNDDSNVKCDSHLNVLRKEILLDNNNSHGYLHNTSLVQATPLHEASNGTTQAWSGATPAPPGFNANYGTNINLSEGSYTDYNNVPEFGMDGSTFGAVHAHAEWNIGPNP
ncbi:hypothetical protein COCVIDRAFT_18858 [Bipolaris victoriae FI3]|uniref:C2H2-type domain-containing protein n=1 Tax=Bipolaris victoriae (strain FI3) TaxID=930091 RepID=W7E065_BIPV3|nr:hypothetical protein COCVIDRAFT_18858 [Bipolaris victoriae FI3]